MLVTGAQSINWGVVTDHLNILVIVSNDMYDVYVMIAGFKKQIWTYL